MVRSERRAAEMTQRELAERVGVSRQTIVSIETSDYAPSVFLALRIAAVLGTTVERLFDPQSRPEPS
nr:helix-turn-helix transcriptional regulator [Solirubrobacter soli]